MGDPRVIKKYPNRRLYDTAESRYITLADIRTLVTGKCDFVVIDKRTDQDITRGILLQVISELEHQEQPLLSKEFLSHIISCYGSELHDEAGAHLEQSLKTFLTQRAAREPDRPALQSVDSKALQP